MQSPRLSMPLASLLAGMTLFACGSHESGNTTAAGTPSSTTAQLQVASATEGEKEERDRQQDRRIEQLEVELAELRHELDELRENNATPPTPLRPPVRKRPDKDTVFAVEIAGKPTLGGAQPLVTLVMGTEYACPFCHRVRGTIKELMKHYGGDLRVVQRSFVVHKDNATEAALASCAAHMQGRFEAMDELLWTKVFEPRKFDRKHIESLLGRAKVNRRKFKQDRDGPCRAVIDQDQRELRAIGQTGTPTFWINGRTFTGAQPLEKFKELIDEERDKALEAMRADPSLNRQNYYDREVLQKGKKVFER